MSLIDALYLDPAPFHIWVTLRGDGQRGSGTISDPYDGHVDSLGASKFDAVMNLPQVTAGNIVVHLGPGVYITKGYSDASPAVGWSARAGMTIVGSGIDVTILQVSGVDGGGHWYGVGHPLGVGNQVDGFRISDLTIDCGYVTSPVSTAFGAVRVMGSFARIQRVRAKNWGTNLSTTKAYVFSLITAVPDAGPPGLEAVNVGMDDCIATDPGPSVAGSTITVLNVGGPSSPTVVKELHAKSPYIRNCYVDCKVGTPSGSGLYHGISMGWCRGGVVEGNQIYNTDVAGPYLDDRSVRDIIVRNNFFKNVAKGPWFNLGQIPTSLGSGINISQTNNLLTFTVGSIGTLSIGDRVRLVALPPANTGVYQIVDLPGASVIVVRSPLSAPTSITSVSKVMSVSRAVIEGNVIELAPNVSGRGIVLDDNNSGGAIAEPPDFIHGEIIIRNNKIRYVDGVAPTGVTDVMIQANGAKNLMVNNNVLDTANPLPDQNSRCGNVTYFNNRSPSGTLYQGWNVDTSRRYGELESQADDAFVLAFAER